MKITKGDKIFFGIISFIILIDGIFASFDLGIENGIAIFGIGGSTVLICLSVIHFKRKTPLQKQDSVK